MKKVRQKLIESTGLLLSVYTTNDEMYELKITEEVESDGTKDQTFVDIKYLGKQKYAPTLNANPCGIEVSIAYPIFKDGTRNDMSEVSKELNAYEDDVNEIYDFLKDFGYIKYKSLKDYPIEDKTDK